MFNFAICSTSSNGRVTSSNPQITCSDLWVTSSNLRATSSYPGVTISNLQVMSSKTRGATFKLKVKFQGSKY